MRWSSLLLPLSLLSTGVLAASKKATERFDTYHKKALTSTPIKIDDVDYKKLTTGSRDYTVAVLLTAMDARYSCTLCKEFQPEWDLLSSSWKNGDKAGKSRTLFTTLDFNDGRETFMSLGLQTAPVLLLFQPNAGEFAVSNADALRFDFTNSQVTADLVRDWIVRYLPGRPHPAVSRPINYMMWITSTISILGTITFLSVAWPYIMPIVTNRKLWAAGSVIFILTFTSGHMFNRIRNTPYVAGDGKGGVSYFAGGFQSQYGLESQIVAALYGVLALATIALVDKVPRTPGVKSQQVAVIVWVAVIVVFYSFLLSVFRIKNGGYPFSLPPFL